MNEKTIDNTNEDAKYIVECDGLVKLYKTSEVEVMALQGLELQIEKGELIAIIGKSGSGKTTLLNIISGNLDSDSGEVWFNNLCVNKLKEDELNGYRSNVIGNIFQDYNLIEYMSVYDNIMLCFNGNKKIDVDTLLKQVGIYDKKYQIVSKLSGGEKQRVAIIRALVNDPKIILADEPTGALDSKSSIEIMEILKKISSHKLVIVVSHDTYLANKYASRIINIKDGNCEYYPIVDNNKNNEKIKKTRIKYSGILKLAFKNLWLKKIRTILTSIAISLGIISMFMVVNLYSNFNHELDKLEHNIVSIFPITVENRDYQLMNDDKKSSSSKIIIKDKERYIHTNKINQKYIDYLNNIKEIKYLTYDYSIYLPIISDKYKIMHNKYFTSMPSDKYIEDNYDILYGRNINNKYEVLLVVDKDNNVSSELLNYFGITGDIEYSEIIGRRIKFITNNECYKKNGDYYFINNDYKEMYDKSNIELSIVGIIREKEENFNDNILYYDKGIMDLILNENSNSSIVKDQIDVDYNLLGYNMLKNDMLTYLGYNTIPCKINIYVSNTKDKEKVIKLLDKYNKDNKKLIYNDMMASSINIVKEFVMIISVVLILFSILGIVISSLMIGILTSVRVLERKKEIGILRSIGFSKRNIKRLFNSENLIIGLIASVISIFVIYILKNPLNNLVSKYIDIDDIFNINYGIMFIIIVINIMIIKISGLIPTVRASKMSIVNCIYNR